MAKTATAKPDRRTAVNRRKPAASISEAAIAARAFEYYCSRGGEHGRDVDDWLAAERDLRTPAPPAAAQLAANG